jgi:putative PIN family toxin of toxin-antitoxin system
VKRRVAIIDTNVVVAGLLTRAPDSPTVRIVDGMLRGQFLFLLSVDLVAEYRAVLLRKRIRERHRLSPGQIDEVLAGLVAEAIVREAPASSSTAPDAGDQHLWDLMSAVPQSVLVTGDLALLTASTDRAVVSPRSWLEEFG